MNPSPTVDGKFAAKDVGGGVPDAPRRGQRLAAHNERRQFATQTRSCGCLPHRGKHCSHPGFAPLNRGPCSQPRNPSLRCKGYGVVMARWRAGHARPLRTAVKKLCTRGAREGGSPPLLCVGGCLLAGCDVRPVGTLQASQARPAPLMGSLFAGCARDGEHPFTPAGVRGNTRLKSGGRADGGKNGQ